MVFGVVNRADQRLMVFYDDGDWSEVTRWNRGWTMKNFTGEDVTKVSWFRQKEVFYGKFADKGSMLKMEVMLTR